MLQVFCFFKEFILQLTDRHPGVNMDVTSSLIASGFVKNNSKSTSR